MTDATKLEWEDPPPDRKRRGSPRQNAMKANPGKWLVWSRNSSSGSWKFLRDRGFAVTLRKHEDGTYTTYARWPEEDPK